MSSPLALRYSHEREEEESQSLLVRPPSPQSSSSPSIPGTPALESGAWGPSTRIKFDPARAVRRHRRWLALAVAGLVACLVLIAVVTGFYYRSSRGVISSKTAEYWGITGYAPESGSGRGKTITIDHVFNGTFSASRVGVNWVAEAGDGVYAVESGGEITLNDLKNNSSRTLVREDDIKNPSNPSSRLQFNRWSLSPTTTHLLLKTSLRKQWRHSSIGRYYIHHIPSSKTFALFADSSYEEGAGPDEAYAEWLPDGKGVVVVKGGDLHVRYIKENGEDSGEDGLKRITATSTGNSSVTTMFNGVPDWVYEEEVFSAESALWVSPSSPAEPNKPHLLTYLTLNSSEVQKYSFPLYNPGQDSHDIDPYLYPQNIQIPYPKPGTPNPVSGLQVVRLDSSDSSVSKPISLTWPGRLPPESSIIQEVAWVSDRQLIVKEVGREAGVGVVVWFDLGDEEGKGAWQDGRDSIMGKVVRTLGKKGEEGDEGWIECSQDIVPHTSSSQPAYLDVIPTPSGYRHIALFSPADSGTPIWVTDGDWEVVGGVLGILKDQGQEGSKRAGDGEQIYFRAARPSSVERGIYSVFLPSQFSAQSEKPVVNVVDGGKDGEGEGGYWSASFSPEAGYYVLGYDGPGVPWQKVGSTVDSAFNRSLQDNENLRKKLAEFDLPEVVFGTVDVDGYELNTKEIRPPGFDESGGKKYPVLFHVYGGPGSQTAAKSYSVNWLYHVACELGYIVTIVDGRGTGFKGRKLRNPVSHNLGFYETHDQLASARIWSEKPYVDKERVGIWGWSYGGFMAAKVAEQGGGDDKVVKLAMSVAPVTSWRLYDSIYTERYMGLPESNPGGYVNASISDVSKFGDLDYLLAHGSGDDNVHFANSARLVDMLTTERIRGWRFRMFTDSDHSIATRGANREVYQFMTDFLVEKWGYGPSRGHGGGIGRGKKVGK